MQVLRSSLSRSWCYQIGGNFTSRAMNDIPQKTLIPTDTGHPQAASGNSCCKALQEAAMVTDEEMRNPSFWMRARATARRLLGLPPYLFSLSLQSCFETARSLAKNTDNRTCTHWHMLLALSQSKDGIAAQLLRAFPLHDEAAVEEMQSHIGPTSET